MEVDKKIITFWCDSCRLDWKVLAERHYKNAVLGEVWMAKCGECGEEMIRLINDAKNDPYFRKSKKVQMDIRKYMKDLIQVDDPRFDILYPHIKAEREEKQARKDRESWEQNKKS